VHCLPAKDRRVTRRVTAREFQKRFQRLDEPVLINKGIFFPVSTAELEGIADRPPPKEKTREEILRALNKGKA